MNQDKENQIKELCIKYQEKATEIIEIKELLKQLNIKLQEAQKEVSNIRYCIEYLNR